MTNNVLEDFVQSRIEFAKTHVVKTVFPSTTNHYDTLFGGEALKWMDEVAFITATRFSRLKVVTVSSDQINFKKPIPAGNFAELIGEVISVGRTSVKVRVNVFLEDMYSDRREMALQGEFSFVAIDRDRNPVSVTSNLVADKEL